MDLTSMHRNLPSNNIHTQKYASYMLFSTMKSLLSVNHLTRKISELLGIVDKPYVFSYSELSSATEIFSASNILGEGGYGPVYKVSFLLFSSLIFFDVMPENWPRRCQ
jgi:hypothetical protein